MNWLSNITPPGIKNMFKSRDDGTDSLWVKCPDCADMIFHRDLEAAQFVCPSCGFHLAIKPKDRIANLFDDGAWERIETPEVTQDPLKFRDEKKYADRLRDARKKTGEQDAMVIAKGALGGMPAVVIVQNFAFMGGSMGMALGESMVAGAQAAVAARAPLIVFTASGGARMQEGILSLMQMPRTTIAVQMMREAGLPYIVVLTHPTTGGVTASYAMLGDVHFAEPGALIGFAGPRVIEQTIREKLPDGFQRSEYLYDKGMVDAVVHRHDMRAALVRLLSVLMKAESAAAAPGVAQGAEAEVAQLPAQMPARTIASGKAPGARKSAGKAAPGKAGSGADEALDKAAE